MSTAVFATGRLTFVGIVITVILPIIGAAVLAFIAVAVLFVILRILGAVAANHAGSKDAATHRATASGAPTVFQTFTSHATR